MSKFGPPKFSSSRAFTHFASAVVRSFPNQRYEAGDVNLLPRTPRQPRAGELRDVALPVFCASR